MSSSDYKVPGAQQYAFSPYESNGGSIVAIAGDAFAVIAADSRLSSGYTIHKCHRYKLFNLSKNAVLGSTGCWCDAFALTSLVCERMSMYEHSHSKTMSTNAVAQMLSILMHNRRFFPYNVSNILAGLDNEGKGVIYSYAPDGHCESTTYCAGGSALLQPVLDIQIGYGNMNLEGGNKPKVTKERAVAVAVDTFILAAERDFYTSDSVFINIITKDGIETRNVPLRKD